MSSKYVRKTDRQSWPEENMKSAIHAVLEGSRGYKKASKIHNVLHSTLEDRVRKAKKNNLTPEQAAVKKLGRYTTVFTPEQEKELVNYIVRLEELPFGITLRDLRSMAFELAEKIK